MKMPWLGLGPEQAYGWRELVVYSKKPGLCRALGFMIAVYDLLGSVHPGIGAAASRADYRVTSDMREGFFDQGLYAQGMLLRLPAGKIASVIGDAKGGPHG